MNQDLQILFGYFVSSFIALFSVWYAFCPAILNNIFAIYFLATVSWISGWWLFETFTQETVQATGKIVLITGCDAGYGHYLAAKLDFLGFNVYAGMLNPEGEKAENLQKNCSERLKIVRLDVTKQEDVDAIVEQIQNHELPFWAVINCANKQISVPFDWGQDVDVYRNLFDVNVFGTVRVTKKCIPLLRRSKGRIVNISQIAIRWQAALAMSNQSVRVFSDVIRRELLDSGIKVVTVEPHVYSRLDQLDSEWKKIFEETPQEIQKHYGETYLENLKIPDVSDNTDMVVDALIDGVMKLHPKPHYCCCSYWEVFKFWALSYLPDVLLDPLVDLVNL